MHKLAQYVFGSGRQQLETNQQFSDDNNQDPESVCFENESNNCSLIHIENDWILIDVDGVQPTSISNHSDAAKSKSNQQQYSGNKKSIQNSSKQRKKFAQYGTTTTLKDRQEIDEQPDLNRTAAVDDGAGVGGGIKNDPNETTLLIEQPSMSVFDNLFVKKPPPTNANNVIVASSASSQPAPSIPALNKAEQRKLIISKIQQSTSHKNGAGNTVNGNKENQSSNNKMKKTKSNRIIDRVPTASSSSLALAAANKNDFTAIVEKDKIIRKANISKKRHQRQNKVATNRNGPLIRQKKMFAHINGVLNNRNSC